jgi:HPt (histidine-containing phosphotransfer) domain-containing protein
MEKERQNSTGKIIVEVDADLEDLIPGFLQRRQQDLRDFRDALSKADFVQIQKLAHTLKGVGGGYGFDTITSISRQIHEAAENERVDKIEAELEALTNYLERVEVVYV